MDIRMINKKNDIINVTNLSIMKSGKWLIGMNDEGKTTQIEEYENEEEVKRNLINIWQMIEASNKANAQSITIHT